VSSSRTDVLVDVTMPQMGVSVAEGTIVAWRVEVGDRIEADETICEISTDKIDTEVPAPTSGVVAEILVPVDTTVAVGTVLARIGGAGGPASDSSATPQVQKEGASNGAAGANGAGGPEPQRQRGRYSPVVQRIAAEHGIDLSTVTGTGRGGRVRKQDVLAVVENGGAAAAPSSAEAAPTVEAPLHIESPYRPEPVAPVGGQLSRMRRQIGEHMKRSLETAAHCTTWIEVDMSRVEAARARLGLTALAYVSSATIAALREHPALNATIEGDAYSRHQDINLGIAVSLGDDGLIVPVIHRAHELSVEGLGARIKDLARRARSRELSPDDVAGGTFTITNPGQYGSIMATPIINQPQVAILDFEAVIKRAVVVTDADGSDSIAIRPMTILGLSWDHRALDGALAAQFLASVKRLLEV
jgi:pyruvate/2-oxoglutarate dehydrogenase complex dihydrolipoamide acyltransferase (E2) component